MWTQPGRAEAILALPGGDTPSHRDDTWRQAIEADQRYAPRQVAHFDHHQLTDQDLLNERVETISFVAALPDTPSERTC